MKVFDNVAGMQTWCKQHKQEGKTIGLVPTMGYLHNGHLALVREARQNCDIVVVSIFVNPIQFGQGEDLAEYPRDLKHDTDLLEKENTDAVFAPTAKEMYPSGYNTFVEVFGEITEKMCGASRPGHFRGVTTVVSKLFNICQPDQAFFGQKDAQQASIVEKMVRELNFPLEIVRVPIVRETDGLALSSRNVYLDNTEREQALILNRALETARQMIEKGERDITIIKNRMAETINNMPLADIDYIEIVDPKDLSHLDIVDRSVIITLAVKIGKTRLIDNLLVEVQN